MDAEYGHNQRCGGGTWHLSFETVERSAAEDGRKGDAQLTSRLASGGWCRHPAERDVEVRAGQQDTVVVDLAQPGP